MNSKTITPASVAKSTGARVTVAQQTVAATISAAKHSEESLSSLLAAATLAGSALITDRFGADADKRDPRAAVKLALAVAKRLADPAAKALQGEAGQNVNACVAALTSGGQTPTDHVLVTVARARLDANAAVKRDARALKNSLAADLADSSKSLESRHAALEQLAGIDTAESVAKSVKLLESFKRAAAAMRADGTTINELVSVLESVFETGI